jgi:hypothetical protein
LWLPILFYIEPATTGTGWTCHRIGLTPTHNGQPGGRRTGQQVSHWINAGGALAISCAEFVADRSSTIYSDQSEESEARKRKAVSKTKYTCSLCSTNAWAKPNTRPICGECDEALEPQTQDDDQQGP